MYEGFTGHIGAVARSVNSSGIAMDSRAAGHRCLRSRCLSGTARWLARARNSEHIDLSCTSSPWHVVPQALVDDPGKMITMTLLASKHKSTPCHHCGVGKLEDSPTGSSVLASDPAASDIVALPAATSLLSLCGLEVRMPS